MSPAYTHQVSPIFFRALQPNSSDGTALPHSSNMKASPNKESIIGAAKGVTASLTLRLADQSSPSPGKAGRNCISALTLIAKFPVASFHGLARLVFRNARGSSQVSFEVSANADAQLTSDNASRGRYSILTLLGRVNHARCAAAELKG